MSTAEQDFNSFSNFARQVFQSGERDVSIDELFDQWRAENPSDEQFAENVAAVEASMKDYTNGERGTIAGEHSVELRRELGRNNR